MEILLSQAFPQYTSRLEEIYNEKNKPTNFLRSYFPTKVSPTKLLSIMVQRAYEQVAVDCRRGDEGHRNQWTQTSEKIFEPLYYRENFDLTSLQVYDALFMPQLAQNSAMIMMLLETIMDKQLEQQYKIERAIEIMCGQILNTGVIQMSTNGTGISVDFKRKSASILNANAAGGYWDGAGDPFKQIETQCNFLRTVGKMQGQNVTVIFGSDAWDAFQANTIVKARQNLFNYNPDQLTMAQPQANSIGSTIFGKFTAGTYRCNAVSYNQYYDDLSSGTAVPTPYIDPKSVIILPDNNDSKFFTFFGAVPQVVQPGAAPIIGDFVAWDWITPDKKAHLYEVESAPLPVPVKVDQIANIKVLA